MLVDMVSRILCSLCMVVFSNVLLAQTDTTINGVDYTLFAPGLWVEDEEPESGFNCGDEVTFEYNGVMVTYGTVESNGRCWMDRNLGSGRVAIQSNDPGAYGDLFQWGRGDDGHQDRDIGPSCSLVYCYNADRMNANLPPDAFESGPWDGKYIYNMQQSPYDWHQDPNDGLWETEGAPNNPCPTGWRIPTLEEWTDEVNDFDPQNSTGAFDSTLKLTVGGLRSHSNGSLSLVHSNGIYWSSTVFGNNSILLSFDSNNVNEIPQNRAIGASIRCIKDED